MYKKQIIKQLRNPRTSKLKPSTLLIACSIGTYVRPI